MNDFDQYPVGGMLLLWLCYFLLAAGGTVIAIFVIGYPALILKWIIDWIKQGLAIARARRQSAPE